MIFEKIDRFIDTHNLVPVGSHCILGLSGGPDSVFLFHYLYARSMRGLCTFAVAHLNHEWRQESLHDAEFCRSVAEQYAIKFYSQKLSFYAQAVTHANGSPEDYARRVRRLFFESVQQKENASTIALAHHRDDHYETFFIRLARGTTLSGLTGIKPRHGAYIRPLLSATKKEILEFLHKNSIPFCTDHTNTNTRYLRNSIRTTLVPALQKTDHRFEHNILRTIESLTESEELLHDYTMHMYNQVITHTNNQQMLSLTLFRKLNPALQKRIIVHWLHAEKIVCSLSEAFIHEIIRFLSHERGGSHHITQHTALHKKHQHAWLISSSL